MRLLDTNGEDKDFIMLSKMLDDNLNEIVGREKQAAQYAKYNVLNNIHDVVLLYDGEIPIGCAGFKKYGDGIAEIKRVFVKSEYRGKGLSKLLMEKIEEKARLKGYYCLILETGKLLKEAQGLYKKMGYHIIENFGQYQGLESSICMKKDIKKK